MAKKGIATPEATATILYGRVSSHDQKEDLPRQIEELKQYCHRENIEKYAVIEDLGSGINYRKRGLQKLLSKVILGEVKRIPKNVEIVVLHGGTEKKFEAQLVEDVSCYRSGPDSRCFPHRHSQT